MDTRANTVKAPKVPKAPKGMEKKTFVEVMSDWIRKYRTPLLAVAAGIVFVIVVVAGYGMISNSRAESAAKAMEAARTSMETWTAATDEIKKAELEKSLLAELDAVAAKFPGHFAAQEALFTKGLVLKEKSEWEAAENAFIAAADRKTKTYLAPIALEAAAIVAEERSAADKAIEYYTRMVDKYKQEAVGYSHALFSLGRLAEGKQDWVGAVAQYDKLVSGTPESSWANLAKDRVIFLKARGLAK